MKFRCTQSLGLATFCLVAAGAAGPNASGDPYAPLRLYEGAWEVHVTTPAKKTDKIVNHCAKTGTLFSCEQEVNGKTTALVVFLPAGKTTSGAQEYRMQALQPDASAPQDWSQLVIDGDTWLYSWDSKEAGKTTHWRNTNHFTGKDQIHFELQSSEDGRPWKTQLAGEEKRVSTS
jgi:hypothetical protein